ncbi:MAG: hypothetical protein KBD63_01725 [Bacteriovoracaceae bacterium]|nr:hypothetical protein [Bacteriovoracaceae bacterium]
MFFAGSSSSSSPQVALLLSQMREAEKLTLDFRKLGVVPVVFEDLQKFGQAISRTRYDFAIVDVLKMRDGDLVLKNHPMIREEQIPLSFFYADQNKHLLTTTYDILNFGYIKSAVDYAHQLQVILKRVNKHLSMSHSVRELKQKNKHLEQKNSQSLNSLQIHRVQEEHLEIVTKLNREIQESKRGESFLTSLIEVLGKWPASLQFAILEITHQGGKLFSPKKEFHSPAKYTELSEIQLPEPCPEGMEFYVQTMGLQVAMETLGSSLVSLKVSGLKKNPDVMIYLRMQEEFPAHFPWQILEELLSASYLKSLSKKRSSLWIEDKKTKKVLSAWDLLGLVQEQNTNLTKHPSFLFELDFSFMTNLIREEKLTFEWTSFSWDFTVGLQQRIPVPFDFSLKSIDKAYLLVHHEHLNFFIQELKEFVQGFPYWRYFESATAVLTKPLAPQIMPLPAETFRLMLNKETSYTYFQEKFEEKEDEAALFSQLVSASSSEKTNPHRELFL